MSICLVLCSKYILSLSCKIKELYIEGERQRGLRLFARFHFEFVVDVLADDRTVAMFEQVHIAESTLGSLATAAHIVFRGDTLEIDVPAVKLALSDDEMWSNCRLWDNYVLDLLSSLFGFL